MSWPFKRILAIGLVLCSCSYPIRLHPSYIVVEFEGWSLFLDEAETLEEAMRDIDPGLRVQPASGRPQGYFSGEGEGSFEAWGVLCRYSEAELHCGDEAVDTSKGGVVLRKDGRIQPSYILPMLAR